jgi:hypothetical protein
MHPGILYLFVSSGFTRIIHRQGPPLCSSGQNSCVQIQRSRVRFPVLPDCLRSNGLERGPLGLLSITEELLGRNSRGSDMENREYGRGDPLSWPRDTLCPQKLALTSPLGRYSSLADSSNGLFYVNETTRKPRTENSRCKSLLWDALSRPWRKRTRANERC